MNTHYLHIFLILLFVQNTLAQKVERKTIIDAHITQINVDVNNCFDVQLVTTEGNELIVEAQMEGEYKEDLILELKPDGSTLFVTADFQPGFENPNDKLSAHKVISIALKLYIPNYKNVKVYGTSANVKATGEFSMLDIVLSDGDCTLKRVTENIKVSTQSGNIKLHAHNGRIDAQSKYGAISKENIPKGDSRIYLHSVSGNIVLKKSG